MNKNDADVLEANHLGKTYKQRPVVHDISIKVRRGEAVGLLGPNGAGKTTCFYMISGLVKPNYGNIKLNNQDITDLPMYRRARLGISYLPQESSIFRGMSVEENIMAVLELNRLSSEQSNIRLEELLAEFSISHLRNADAISLSGGERRRVEIARTLASDPKYILLDEPLAGIDPIAITEVRKIIGHLKNKGIGVLITDHNVQETLKLIDRAYIIFDGRVLMEGTAKEIVNNSLVKKIYLGEKFSA